MKTWEKDSEYVLEAEDILEVINKVNSKFLKMTFDIAHCNTVINKIISYYNKIKEQ